MIDTLILQKNLSNSQALIYDLLMISYWLILGATLYINEKGNISVEENCVCRAVMTNETFCQWTVLDDTRRRHMPVMLSPVPARRSGLSVKLVPCSIDVCAGKWCLLFSTSFVEAATVSLPSNREMNRWCNIAISASGLLVVPPFTAWPKK